MLDPPAGPTVHLLPAFDPYVVGGLRQLDHVMTGGDRAQVSRPQGWIAPTLVTDGRIAGTWESVANGDVLTVTVTAFGRLSRPVRAAVGEAVTRLVEPGAATRLRFA